MEYKLSTRRHTGDSNALEILNFSLLREIPEGSYLNKDFKSWVEDESKSDIHLEKSVDITEKKYKTHGNNDEESTQFICFQRSMKVLNTYAMVCGINPVSCITDHDIKKVRFKLFSFRFSFTAVIALSQTIIAAVCLHNFLSSPISMKSLVFCCVSFTSWLTTMIFIRIATKWEMLIKEISQSKLDKYVDLGVVMKCQIICAMFWMLALGEFILYIISKMAEVLNCEVADHNLFEKIVRTMSSPFFQIGVPYSKGIGLILQLNILIMTLNWSFTDTFIVCISVYLTSVLKQVNKKILWASDENYLAPSTWGSLRQDYSRATRLIRSFDDVVSGLILLCFGTNLFWICLQIFNVLENGLTQVHQSSCPHYHHGLFNGYEHSISSVYSLIVLVVRFLTMCLAAANINEAASVPAMCLYKVPACCYSLEVQRFLDQVHDDVVALSGLQYFYITRELVLSVAGTILTYELVLLQFRDEEANDF